MGKFKFSAYRPANVAKPAKTLDSQGYTSANNLLMFAKVEQEKQQNTGTLANISNTLASQEPFKINNISNISNISRGQGVKPEKTFQQQHADLWLQADKMADWIDDSKSAIPWQERAAKVPELQVMTLELSRLEKSMRDELLSLISINHNSVEETQINLRLQSDFLQGFSPLVQVTQGGQYTLDNCPARCKQTGKCYGTAYFDAKPGKTIDCIPNQCSWNDQL